MGFDTQWWNIDIMKTWPFSLEDHRKSCQMLFRYKREELYQDYYRPNEYNVMQDLFAIKEVSYYTIFNINNAYLN